MHLHEYQAKRVLKSFGVPIPEFFVASSVEEAKEIVEGNDLKAAVVKVQVHAGGRGKAGGVKIAKSAEEIVKASEELIGMKIVTKQTGPEGMVAHKVLIDRMVDIAEEYYLGAVIDRKRKRAMLVASPEGGMNIEEIAEQKPDRILSIPIRLDGSIRSYHLIKLAKFMGWGFKGSDPAMKMVKALAKAFIQSDASLLEINPLVKTKEGEYFAIDAKMTIDDNALYRQRELADDYDPTQQPEAERKAHEHNLAYVAMEGNIGCMVNGAGLAMSTMDIIHFYGGEPANFLDVGGGADEEKVAAGFRLILSDPNVKALLVNIFGGIMNCQTIAKGVIKATSEEAVKVPLVVRLEGTDVDKGKALLKESGLNIIVANTLAEAAEKVVKEAD